MHQQHEDHHQQHEVHHQQHEVCHQQHEVHHQQHEVRHQQSVGSERHKQQPIISTLMDRERALRSEIDALRHLPPSIIQVDKKVTDGLLLEELQNITVNLKETLVLVETQQEELEAANQVVKDQRHQLDALHGKLTDRCKHLQEERSAHNSTDTISRELRDKITIACRAEQEMMRKLVGFVDEHFPIPSSQQIKCSMKLRSSTWNNRTEILSLKDMLLELITQCVEHPEDPYMCLDESHWPAYVELLLRCNIVMQHPDDYARVKLVPFHL